MGAKFDLSDDGKNIGCGRSRSGKWGRYVLASKGGNK